MAADGARSSLRRICTPAGGVLLLSLVLAGLAPPRRPHPTRRLSQSTPEAPQPSPAPASKPPPAPVVQQPPVVTRTVVTPAPVVTRTVATPVVVPREEPAKPAGTQAKKKPAAKKVAAVKPKPKPKLVATRTLPPHDRGPVPLVALIPAVEELDRGHARPRRRGARVRRARRRGRARWPRAASSRGSSDEGSGRGPRRLRLLRCGAGRERPPQHQLRAGRNRRDERLVPQQRHDSMADEPSRRHHRVVGVRARHAGDERRGELAYVHRDRRRPHREPQRHCADRQDGADRHRRHSGTRARTRAVGTTSRSRSPSAAATRYPGWRGALLRHTPAPTADPSRWPARAPTWPATSAPADSRSTTTRRHRPPASPRRVRLTRTAGTTIRSRSPRAEATRRPASPGARLRRTRVPTAAPPRSGRPAPIGRATAPPRR